jgi:bifunctional UDP-N-acetylglucosamine pyrophosphorylase / glucosamine-1-phosphate N-acetyltransferase
MSLSVIILAAGQGKRMRSTLPKVLHPLGGRPLLAHVLDVADRLSPTRCVIVYGHGGDAVRSAFTERTDLLWAEQRERLGTGHAVARALPLVSDGGVALVLYGDVPLLNAAMLEPLVDAARGGRLALLTSELVDPSGYGRIVRAVDGSVARIVEERDADPAQRAIREINTGILAAPATRLRDWVNRLGNDNAQGEYYLTDCIALAVADGVTVTAIAADPIAAQGVNDRVQLAELERRYQWQQAETLMRAGATLLDPHRLDVRGQIEVGQDVLIDVNVVFEGEVTLGNGVRIGSHCLIRDCVIEAGTVIHSHCVLESARIGPAAEVGPFARLRPGTRLGEKTRIGNFVETKNAVLKPGAKANHLSYLGDAEVGAGSNIGAGTITCNYDGANKHRTVIEDDVFIGSNTALVAPIHVGTGATVGAGSTLNRDVPAGTLTLTRAPLKQIERWQRPRKPR